MRILWIDDLPTESLAIALFKDLLNSDDFENYDKEKEIEKELSRFFRDNSIHDISVCKGYSGFINKYEKDYLQYDIFIIDLDLSEEQQDFKQSMVIDLKKAGFNIWNILIRKGIPEDHIAFMTGNGDSIKPFEDHCKVACISPLKDENVFIKEEDSDNQTKVKKGYSQFREWLGRKANTDYIQLRRGILDACTFFQKSEYEILLNKTLKEDGDGKKIDELSKEYGKEFTIHIKNLFIKDFLLEGKEKTQKLYTFLMVLSAEWERGDSRDSEQLEHFKEIKIPSERCFYESIFWIMCNLRNCFAHFTVPKENLLEQDIAFFFMLAMRGFFEMKINEIEEYEKILFPILKNSNVEIKINDLIKINKKALEQIKSLYKKYSLGEQQDRRGKQFRQPKDFQDYAFRFLNGSSQNKNEKLIPIPRDAIKKESKEIFYNSYLIKMETTIGDANSKDKLFYKLGAFALEAASIK